MPVQRVQLQAQRCRGAGAERRCRGGAEAQRGAEARTCQLSAGGSLLLSRVAATASMEPCCLRSLKALIGPG